SHASQLAGLTLLAALRSSAPHHDHPYETDASTKNGKSSWLWDRNSCPRSEGSGEVLDCRQDEVAAGRRDWSTMTQTESAACRPGGCPQVVPRSNTCIAEYN